MIIIVLFIRSFNVSMRVKSIIIFMVILVSDRNSIFMSIDNGIVSLINKVLCKFKKNNSIIIIRIILEMILFLRLFI